jgi:hypothetical protein
MSETVSFQTQGERRGEVAVRKHLHQAALRKLRIPTGFRHSAQRCDEGATLGPHSKTIQTLKGF